MKDMDSTKCRDLSSNLYELEARVRDVENQIFALRKESDDVRFSNNSMMDRNNEMKDEIEAL